jgi:hypothetical protein
MLPISPLSITLQYVYHDLCHNLGLDFQNYLIALNSNKVLIKRFTCYITGISQMEDYSVYSASSSEKASHWTPLNQVYKFITRQAVKEFCRIYYSINIIFSEPIFYITFIIRIPPCLQYDSHNNYYIPFVY